MVITATLAGEETWLEALRNGWDLHSRNADLVFGQEWEDAAEHGCAYFENQGYQKCKCPEHEKLRDAVKDIANNNFYGGCGYSTPKI